MGKYLDKFKNKINKTKEVVENVKEKRDTHNNININTEAFTDADEGDMFDDDKDDFFNENETNIYPAQKPESFHHFILENQYKDLERSIRGFKDVYDKEKEVWDIRRKKEHCFTDEEAEEILRTAQSHLATDIKLSFISKESFPLLMDAIYKQLSFIFRSISEYKYGRYGTYEKQYEMKVENLKIFLELITRIQANYSRAIQGTENKSTHGSVKAQESLQSSEGIDRLNHMRRWS